MFKSKSRREAEETQRARAAAEAQRSAEARQARERRADAWRADRNKAIAVLHAAEREHASAMRDYRLYAPGPQKDAAGRKVNEAADRMKAARSAFQDVDDFRTWDGNNR